MAANHESEPPSKRHCVMRQGLSDQSAKYYKDRYDTLMEMRDAMMPVEAEGGGAGEQQSHLLIGTVFITTRIAQ